MFKTRLLGAIKILILNNLLFIFMHQIKFDSVEYSINKPAYTSHLDQNLRKKLADIINRVNLKLWFAPK